MGSSIKTGEVFPGRIGDYQKGGSEVKRGILIIAIIAAIMTTPCYATTAHEQAMSFILSQQDLPQEPGDILYIDEDTEKCPILVETTGYHQGTHGSHGDRMKRGYVAFSPETYGCAIEVYEAIPTDEGYSLGKYIGLYQIKDCGYGKSTGQGTSSVRSDKKHEGTIEAGLSVDTYFPTLSECREWMEKTQGMIFIQIIPAEG